MRIAIIFNNFGPYHVARLSALAKCCNILAIEVVGRSAEYGWKAASSVSFARKTLFPTESCSDFNAREYLHRLDGELSLFDPDVLAIPGWYGLDALQAMGWAQQRNTRIVVMSESQRRDFKRSKSSGMDENSILAALPSSACWRLSASRISGGPRNGPGANLAWL